MHRYGINKLGHGTVVIALNYLLVWRRYLHLIGDQLIINVQKQSHIHLLQNYSCYSTLVCSMLFRIFTSRMHLLLGESSRIAFEVT